MFEFGPQSSRPVYIAVHTTVATVFMAAVQRWILDQPWEVTLAWAVAFGGAAAILAWRQTTR